MTSDPGNHNFTNGFTYDAVGNRKQWLVNGSVTNGYTYDADDRLGSDLYDAEGNTILSGGVSDAYDFENHLIQKGGVTLVYDGDGNRVSETVGGVTTNFLVDTVNPTGYAQVVDELQNGSVTRIYSYGLERISQTQSTSGTATTSFYGYDGHGSVRQLTNSVGVVTDSYDYDAFGNLINSTGSTPNVYLFAGEQYDPALGLYYNRARYLDTTTGRFWSMDNFEGNNADPLSLHKYLFTGNNPVGRIDPTGHESIPEVMISIATQTILGALSGLSVSTVLFGVAVYNTLARLPKDAFSKPADATLVGFQVSRSVSDFIPKSTPFLDGLAFGLSFTAGTGGVEALFPRFTNTAWFYAYIGFSTGVKVPAGGQPPAGYAPPIEPNPNEFALPEFYVGKVWNLKNQDSYAGPFYCVSGQLAAAKFPGVPRGPNVQACASTNDDGTPGAYSLVLGGSDAATSLSSSITKYYYYGEYPRK